LSQPARWRGTMDGCVHVPSSQIAGCID